MHGVNAGIPPVLCLESSFIQNQPYLVTQGCKWIAQMRSPTRMLLTAKVGRLRSVHWQGKAVGADRFGPRLLERASLAGLNIGSIPRVYLIVDAEEVRLFILRTTVLLLQRSQDRMTPKNNTPKPAAARLRDLLRRDDHITVCPGVYDGLTARIALQAGFDALYMVRRDITSTIFFELIFIPLRLAPVQQLLVSACQI